MSLWKHIEVHNPGWERLLKTMRLRPGVGVGVGGEVSICRRGFGMEERP